MLRSKQVYLTRKKLLDSASMLIGQHGFDAVSVEDITKNAGVAKGTFYHYFETKESIVEALSRQTMGEILEKAVHMEGTLKEKMAFYILELMAQVEFSGVRIVRQWMRSVMDPSPGGRDGVKDLSRGYDAISSIFLRSVEEGELLPTASVDTLTKLLLSHVYGAVVIWCMMNGSFSIAEEGERYVRLELTTLLAPYLAKED